MVEEDAFQLLEQYLNSMKQYFAGEKNADEILADIESGLAEKFAEKANSTTQAITIIEAQRVIAIMGRVDEIAGEEKNDVVATVAPEAPATKRLYRNPSDMVIAGVCSGLAAYFGIDVLWVRIAFVVLGFANGLGILAYIILWIIVPRAETSAQQLEMRGRPVNVSEIQEVVKEKAAILKSEGTEVIARLKADDSVLRKIVTIPVIIIQAIISAIKRIIQTIIPVVGISIGVLILGGAMVAMAALTITAGLFLFGIRSPYIISDLPLTELAARPLYYVGVVALFFILFLPLVFMVWVGRTLVQRKNVFTARAMAILAAFWLVSLSAGAGAGSDLIPLAYTRAQAIAKEQQTTRTFPQQGFTKLKIDTDARIRVQQGAQFAITFTGRAPHLDRLNFEVKNGELVVTEGEDTIIGPCFFCSLDQLDGEITLPELSTLTTAGASQVTVAGFTGDLALYLEDASRVDAALSAAAVTTTLRDVGRLTLGGQAQRVSFILSNASWLQGDGLVVEEATFNLADVSRAFVQGEARRFTATLKDTATLQAAGFIAEDVRVDARDVSRASVAPTKTLTANAFDVARVRYQERGATTTFETYDQGRIEELEE